MDNVMQDTCQLFGLTRDQMNILYSLERNVAMRDALLDAKMEI